MIQNCPICHKNIYPSTIPHECDTSQHIYHHYDKDLEERVKRLEDVVNMLEAYMNVPVTGTVPPPCDHKWIKGDMIKVGSKGKWHRNTICSICGEVKG